MRLWVHSMLILLIAGQSVLGNIRPDRAMPDSSAAPVPLRALTWSLIPGGGQLYNRRPLKALLYGGAFAFFAYRYAGAERDYQANPGSQSLHRTRNDQIWLMSLTWTLNLLDAYIDAQLWDFNAYPVNETDIPDPEIVKPKETDLPHDKK
jgi:hypothetical protein